MRAGRTRRREAFAIGTTLMCVSVEVEIRNQKSYKNEALERENTDHTSSANAFPRERSPPGRRGSGYNLCLLSFCTGILIQCTLRRQEKTSFSLARPGPAYLGPGLTASGRARGASARFRPWPAYSSCYYNSTHSHFVTRPEAGACHHGVIHGPGSHSFAFSRATATPQNKSPSNRESHETRSTANVEATTASSSPSRYPAAGGGRQLPPTAPNPVAPGTPSAAASKHWLGSITGV
jgi:hypothetical protein